MSNRPRLPSPGGGNRDDDDDKGRPAGGSRPSNPFNRSSSFGKPDDSKKDSGTKAPFGSRLPFGGRDDEDDKDEPEENKPGLNRPGGFGLGNKSPFGRPTSDEDDEDDEDDAPRPASRLGGSSPFGSKVSGGDAPKPASPFGGKPAEKPADKPGSSPFGSKVSGGDAPKPASPLGGKPAEKPADKPGSSPFGSKVSGRDAPKPASPFGGKPAEKPAEKKDDKPGGGILGGGLRSPFGGKPDDKPADKKDDKPAGGGLRLPFGGRPGDKPADKKDDKPGGGILGGVRLPFGGKPDDKAAGGGLRSPFGGRPGDKPAEKKDDKPGGGILGGGVRLPFGGKPDDKAADKKDDKPAGGLRSPFGGKPAEKPAEKKDDKPGGGGLLGRLPFGRAPDKAADKPGDVKRTTGSSPAVRPGSSSLPTPARPATTTLDPKKTGSKVPPARGEKVAKPLERAPKQVTVQQGLSLDQKLDLAGFALIGLGILVFFAAWQPEGEITKGLGNFLGGLFGDARKVMCIPPLAVGLWLFIQRFNENPLVIKIHRAAGYILLLFALVTTWHYFVMLQKTIVLVPGVPDSVNLALLVKASDTVARAQQGGGWLGGELYKLLMQAFGLAGDYATPIVLIGVWLIAFMLSFSITVGEVAIYVRSVFRWFVRVRNSYVESRRAAQAAKAAAAPLTIEKPAPPAIGTGATPAAAALAAPLRKAAGIPERTGALEPEPVGAPRLAAGTAGSKAASDSAKGVARKSTPFGKPPAAKPDVQEDVSDEEGAEESAPVPATRPAPTLFGSRPAAASTTGAVKAAEPKTEVKSEKPTPFGTRPAQATETAKPTPFGARPTSAATKADEDIEDEEASDEDAAPIVKPSPLASARPALGSPGGKPGGPFGPKPTSTDDQPSTQNVKAGLADTAATSAQTTSALKPTGGKVAVESDEEDKPEAVKPATPIGIRSPFGPKPGTDKPASSPFARPASKTEDDGEADEKGTEAPAVKAEAPKPATPFGSRPNPFGPKPGADKDADKSEDKDTDEDEAEAPAVKAEAPKPATPFGSRPNPFGPKPGADKDADKSEDKDADEDEAEAPAVKAEAPKPATPFGSRPNPFGPKPGADKPASSPFARPASKTEDDDSADAPDIRPATPKFAATPGNRPNPFGGSASIAPRPVPKPGLATPPPSLEEDETDENDNEPKYVAVDDVEVDDELPSSGPRPTLTRQAGIAPASMPRPANPVLPRPRPGSESPKAEEPARAGEPAITPSAQVDATPVKEPEKAEEVNAAPAKPESVLDKAPAVPVQNTAAVAEKEPAVEVKPAPEATAPQKPAVAEKPPESEASRPVPVPVAEAKPSLEGTIIRSKSPSGWEIPDFRELLEAGSQHQIKQEVLNERARIIEETLKSFGAPGKVVEINSGPVITQFGVEPDYLVNRQGKKTRVKVSAIARLDADLALALAARSIRIEAPVPGKGYVGIEVPNAETALVSLRDIMASEEFQNIKSKLRIGLGKSVDGTPIAADLTQMPHLLIAGTTGSGKSVCVNAIISCLLLNNSPDDLKMIMVDPKRVELTGYNGIPHLISPVVVDLERIVGVLKWVSREMDERYKKFSQAGARNISDYNSRVGPSDPKLPYLVVIVDELADLMMLAPEETEKVLTRLAQMARATGIHLVISTQRPSVDVVTGLIKANFPARISFAVASSVDSRVILDQPGAEKLLGRGDMLYQSPDAAAPLRMQGVFVSDAEINRITRYWKNARTSADGGGSTPAGTSSSLFDLNKPEPVQSRSERFSQPAASSTPLSQRLFGDSVTEPDKPKTVSTLADSVGEDDDMYDEAVQLVKKMNKASISLLQRRLRIGYTRAARLIDLMAQRGVISASAEGDDGSRQAISSDSGEGSHRVL
jgi:DNA segregation ATPase FtsK/SpoIIIE-like protein